MPLPRNTYKGFAPNPNRPPGPFPFPNHRTLKEVLETQQLRQIHSKSFLTQDQINRLYQLSLSESNANPGLPSS